MSHYERNRELVISGVVSPLIWVRSIVTLLITLLIATHEPPSRGYKYRVTLLLTPSRGLRFEGFGFEGGSRGLGDLESSGSSFGGGVG